jgi:hypothetical protein
MITLWQELKSYFISSRSEWFYSKCWKTYTLEEIGFYNSEEKAYDNGMCQKLEKILLPIPLLTTNHHHHINCNDE